MKSSSCGQSSDQLESHSSVCHQLTQSLVKPFKTSLDFQSIDCKQNIIKKYICNQCLDEFIHESSLTTHLERRSVSITYLCDKCKERLIFFNRCTLLSHIRSHIEISDQNEERIRHQLSQVFVQPIDLSQLFTHLNKNKNISINNNCIKDNKSVIDGIQRHPNVFTPKTIAIKRDSNESNPTINPKPIENKKPINTSNDLIAKKFVIKKSTNSELKCSQCNHSFNSLWTREQHLVDKQLVLPLNQCKLCPTICATNCSQSIHNRLHMKSDPNSGISCPECGNKLDETNPTDLITHIVFNCLHLSRRLVYICMFCSHKMSSLIDFIQHIKSVHTTQYFQCSQCLQTFQSEPELREHNTNSHSSDLKPIVCHKCPICETQHQSMTTYSDHFTSHRKKFFNFSNFTFVCLKCNESFVTKTELKSHFNSFHTNDSKTETERKTFINETIDEISVRFKLNVRFDCNINSNKTEKNKNNKNFEKRNGNNIDSNESTSKRAKNVSENDSKSHSKDNTNDIKDAQKSVNDNWFECRECGLNFPFVQTLKRHLILEHRIHDVESYINNTYIEIPIVVTTEPQLPKEVGEERLSQILDSEDSTDTMCPICSLKFSDCKELKIHGRVHGMAFIKSCHKKSI